MIVMIFVVMIFLGIFCFKDKNQEILKLKYFTWGGVGRRCGGGEGMGGSRSWFLFPTIPTAPHPNLTNTIVATTDADAV